MTEKTIPDDNNSTILINIQRYGYKPLQLEDKQLFTSKFDYIQPKISEFTFTNLYMWREYYQYAWKELENGSIILISAQDPTKLIGFPIIGENYTDFVTEMNQLKTRLNLPVEIHRIPDSDVEKLKDIIPNIDIIEDRDNWDYIYSREELVKLEGKPYATIRRKLNKFNREFPITVKPLSSANAQLCLQLQEEWCNLRACSDTPSLDNEDKAIQDILLHFDQLDFMGFVVLLEEKIIGYSIGEKLNNSTIISHVEKGNTEFFGLYQALNHIFAEKYAVEFKFVNREQDLGVPGLRQSKESYHPIEYVKKYIIVM